MRKGKTCGSVAQLPCLAMQEVPTGSIPAASPRRVGQDPGSCCQSVRPRLSLGECLITESELDLFLPSFQPGEVDQSAQKVPLALQLGCGVSRERTKGVCSVRWSLFFLSSQGLQQWCRLSIGMKMNSPVVRTCSKCRTAWIRDSALAEHPDSWYNDATTAPARMLLVPAKERERKRINMPYTERWERNELSPFLPGAFPAWLASNRKRRRLTFWQDDRGG